jgi:D-glutamate cyclase
MEPETTVEHEVIDISPIVTMAAEKSVLSIGVGDHGNEIGFGRIVDTVAATMPNGDKLCTCVGTDILLPAMMSNWGCYGIEAALAFLLKRPKIVHSPAQEERIIRACQMAGGIDAIYACTEFGVDGLDGETSMACMQFLGNIVRKSLEDPDTGAAH